MSTREFELAFSWAALQNALTVWPQIDLSEEAAHPAEDAILGRIRQILIDAQGSGSIHSANDLVALVRHALMSRSSRSLPAQLRVPKDAGWPSAEVWRRSSVRTIDTGTSFILQADPWRPDWIDGSWN